MALQIEAPLYMVGVVTPCWRCDTRMSVITLLAPHVAGADGQVCLLGEIRDVPPEILSYIQQRVPTFRFRSSRMGGTRYLANTCPKCRVIFGDFFLHSEPGALFFPTSEKEAKSLYMREIPILHPVEIEASPGVGTGELILANAKRLTD